MQACPKCKRGSGWMLFPKIGGYIFTCLNDGCGHEETIDELGYAKVKEQIEKLRAEAVSV